MSDEIKFVLRPVRIVNEEVEILVRRVGADPRYIEVTLFDDGAPDPKDRIRRIAVLTDEAAKRLADALVAVAK